MNFNYDALEITGYNWHVRINVKMLKVLILR